ncbi:MAG: glutamate--tRNA ligase family protein [Phycisphaerales bacterium]
MSQPTPAKPETTRLAPSPTGALHLGNARTFLVNWALARRLGWRVILRIEDLDTPRNKPGAAGALIDTLRWLGLDWDSGPTIQSADLTPYAAAMRSLASRALTYPSELTRGQVEAVASAPQDGSHETPFPASLRPPIGPRGFDDPGTNWRFATPPGPLAFDDEFAGPQRHDVSATVGDFVIWTRRGQPSYQLAVVVDDHRQGVTRVVRGDDLLDSAARQLLLYRALGHAPEPRYIHLPLVRGADGKRLAKRHGDTRIDTYRAAGATPERVIGLVAFWSGALDRRTPMSASEFRSALDLARVPRKDVTFTPEDHAWLLNRA